jgi:pimeloyl-ACP methyl ester carboxylesterase
VWELGAAMIKFLAGATALIVLAHGAEARGQDAAAPVPDPAYLAYAVTDAAATLPDGRRIQIVCMGEGSPTVILTAGLGDWGASWRKVQGPIAEHARVCSWDRAGVGFSDASEADQTTQTTASDLEAALVAADIVGPYVMVGHSLGAFESMTFTDRHPDQVVGFVSVDGSFPDQMARFREGSPTIVALGDQMQSAEDDRARQCIVDLQAGQVVVGGEDPNGCLSFPPDYPEEISTVMARLNSDGRRLATQASLGRHLDQSAADLANPARDYGDIPLVVLTAGATPTDLPEPALAAWPQHAAVWTRGHDEVAALSSRGVNRIVPDAGHYIQTDRPDVVIATVIEVVEAARGPRP